MATERPVGTSLQSIEQRVEWTVRSAALMEFARSSRPGWLPPKRWLSEVWCVADRSALPAPSMTLACRQADLRGLPHRPCREPIGVIVWLGLLQLSSPSELSLRAGCSPPLMGFVRLRLSADVHARCQLPGARRLPSVERCHPPDRVPSLRFLTALTASSTWMSRACCIPLPAMRFVAFPPRAASHPPGGGPERPRVFPATRFTLRRIPLVSSRTASPRPVPSCRYLSRRRRFTGVVHLRASPDGAVRLPGQANLVGVLLAPPKRGPQWVSARANSGATCRPPLTPKRSGLALASGIIRRILPVYETEVSKLTHTRPSLHRSGAWPATARLATPLAAQSELCTLEVALPLTPPRRPRLSGSLAVERSQRLHPEVVDRDRSGDLSRSRGNSRSFLALASARGLWLLPGCGSGDLLFAVTRPELLLAQPPELGSVLLADDDACCQNASPACSSSEWPTSRPFSADESVAAPAVSSAGPPYPSMGFYPLQGPLWVAASASSALSAEAPWVDRTWSLSLQWFAGCSASASRCRVLTPPESVRPWSRRASSAPSPARRLYWGRARRR